MKQINKLEKLFPPWSNSLLWSSLPSSLSHQPTSSSRLGSALRQARTIWLFVIAGVSFLAVFRVFFLQGALSACQNSPYSPNESSAENGPRSGETANALDRVRELSSIVPIRRARFTILCTRAPSNHSRCSDSSSVGRVGSCCVQVSAAFAKKRENQCVEFMSPYMGLHVHYRRYETQCTLFFIQHSLVSWQHTGHQQCRNNSRAHTCTFYFCPSICAPSLWSSSAFEIHHVGMWAGRILHN